MPQVVFGTSDSGAIVRPLSLRLLRAPVSASDAAPAWGAEQEEPYWRPEQLTWGCNGALSTLTLRYIHGTGYTGYDAIHADDSWKYLSAGDRFILQWMLPGGDPIEIFRGHVGQGVSGLAPSGGWGRISNW